MLLSTRAFIIHSFPYSDSSIIVKAYTEKLGFSSFLLKGFKRNRKQKVNIHPLALVEISCSVNEQINLKTGRSISLVRPYSEIMSNPVKSGMAMFLAEFLSHTLNEDKEGDSDFFSWLIDAIDQLESSRSIANFHLWFLLRLSDFLGFAPQGKRTMESPYFNIKEGSFIKIGEAIENSSESESLLIDSILHKNLWEINEIAFSRKERALLLNLLHTYFQDHLEKEFSLKSLDILSHLYSD
jgi:DNA repair protein RecO (recombination protein O)